MQNFIEKTSRNNNFARFFSRDVTVGVDPLAFRVSGPPTIDLLAVSCLLARGRTRLIKALSLHSRILNTTCLADARVKRLHPLPYRNKIITSCDELPRGPGGDLTAREQVVFSQRNVNRVCHSFSNDFPLRVREPLSESVHHI